MESVHLCLGIFAIVAIAHIKIGQSESIVNQYCINSNDCGANFICGNNRTCQCERFYAPNRNGDRCVGIIGQRCKYDEHCINGAFCEQQVVCKCKENLAPSEDNYACSNFGQPLHLNIKIILIACLLFVIK